MAQIKEKVKYLWFGEKAPMDTTIKTVNVNNLILSMLVVGGFFYFMSIFILWRDLPFLPINQGENGTLYFAGGLLKWTFSWFLPALDTGVARSFQYWLLSLKGSTEILGVVGRAIITLGATIYGGYLGFKMSNVPVGGEKHVKGKLILRAKEAYDNLKGEFAFLSKNGRGARLVVASENPFNPEKDYIDDLKPGTYIELPEKLRRSHSMYVAGTGRGKTQLIMYREVQQVHRRIAAGEVIKMMICDTPKSDYSRVFADKNIYKIAPHEEGGIAWNIAEDLTDSLLAEAFWKGKIPINDSDPIWGNAAITVATGCTRYLQVVAPKAWNYGMLAHLLTKNGEFLEPILTEHYPEAKQILGTAGETLSSVMFNLGSYTQDLISLARIYDGFEVKKAIYQSTSKALKNPAYVQYVFKDMTNTKAEVGKEPAHLTKCIMFKGTCLYLTDKNPNWTWSDFSEFVQQNKLVQATLVSPYVRQEDEAKLIDSLSFEDDWKVFSKIVVQYASKWDEIEGERKLSIRDWLIAGNPPRKILILKPSETYPTLTEGLIKGILYYANSVILGSLKDEKSRRFHIIIDELQSYGNIEPFLGPALALYRSRGVSLTLAFQDLSQLVKIYGQEFVDFVNSNIGNINILGVNDGFTANKFTELLGERKISKMHKTRTPDGGSSENLQEHDEKVILANEWNLLGANEALMNITYVNLIGGLNPAYMLTAPIMDYKVRSEQVKANWVENGFDVIIENNCQNFDAYWEGKIKKAKKEAEDIKIEEEVITDHNKLPDYKSKPFEKLLKESLKKDVREAVQKFKDGE